METVPGIVMVPIYLFTLALASAMLLSVMNIQGWWTRVIALVAIAGGLFMVVAVTILKALG